MPSSSQPNALNAFEPGLTEKPRRREVLLRSDSFCLEKMGIERCRFLSAEESSEVPSVLDESVREKLPLTLTLDTH